MATRLISRTLQARQAPRLLFQASAYGARPIPAWRRTVATKKFTPEHEYVVYDDSSKIGTMSITDYAQKALGDVVFVELPAVGSSFDKGELIGAVESVKAASDIYAPLSGKVTEVNERLNSEPGLLNKDPEGAGWLCKLEVTKPEEMDGLLDDKAYKAVCEGEAH